MVQRYIITLMICCVISWFAAAMASAQYPRPKPKLNLPTPLGYVSDYAEVLSPQWSAQIRAVCKELEQRTGVELIVVTMPTVAPLSTVQEYASTLYEGWRIGTAQQQRGVLLLTSMQENKAVVVLGRSLLSVVNRQQLDDISQEFLVPMFQRDELGMHLYQATVRLAAASGKIQLREKTTKKPNNVGFWMNLTAALTMCFILWRFTRPERRHPFQRWRRGEYWSTGQGGFGGNFGSFGGKMEE
ncbi:MAG: TPM domain-containing protein [Nitrospirales bacterium]